MSKEGNYKFTYSWTEIDLTQDQFLSFKGYFNSMNLYNQFQKSLQPPTSNYMTTVSWLYLVSLLYYSTIGKQVTVVYLCKSVVFVAL